MGYRRPGTVSIDAAWTAGAAARAVAACLALALVPHAALSADGAADPGAAGQSLPAVMVIGATPVPGVMIDADKFPGNVQVLTSGDLAREGSPGLATALNSRLGSVSVNDNLDDPFQPDILYRGFEASPVLGTPQGLAVYQNGVRINEAFGDTVNWDLFPDVAIDGVELVSSSPLYGRNALGGAIAVSMKDGFRYQGSELELSGGSFGKRSAVAQVGMNAGDFGFYAAGRAVDWDGWRDFSGDRVRSLYSAISWHTERATLDVSYTRADNDLHGQGAAPVQELAVSRSLVFTGPQGNQNSLNFAVLNGTLGLGGHWSLQGVAYYRDDAQGVANGNTTNYIACRTRPGILCQPDGLTPLVDAAGKPLPDISQGGTVPIGENDAEQVRAWGRGLSLQVSSDAPLAGVGNRLSVGAAIDDAATTFRTGTQVGALSSQLVVLPSNLVVDTPENSPAAIANGDPTPVGVDSVDRGLGLFVTDTADVSGTLSVTASGRYNVTRIGLADQRGSNLSGDSRYVHFNPAIGLTLRVLPSTTLFGGLSDNTRTPTASEIECSSPAAPCLLPSNLAGDPPTLRQVVAHTAELGLRGQQGGAADAALTWNLGIFRTVLHDDIYGIATSVSQGFFENIGDTRRQGIEAGIRYRSARWSAFFNYSLVQATFQSAFLAPSPSNPLRDAFGDVHVTAGDHLPGIPQNRLKLGLDHDVSGAWTVGTAVSVVGSAFYAGDESSALAPVPGYVVAGLHANYRPSERLEAFASVSNLFNRRYATWGILSDPTGVGAPGVPVNGVTNGPGVDNRFQSPAAPFGFFAGLRLRL